MLNLGWIKVLFCIPLIVITILSFESDYEMKYPFNDASTLLRSSFCSIDTSHAGSGTAGNFPSPIPGTSNAWIWDVKFDSTRGYIEFTVFSRQVCYFDTAMWSHFYKMFPEYSDQFAYGSLGNVYVQVNKSSSPIAQFSDYNCLVYINGNGELLLQLKSTKIQRSHNWAHDSAMQLRFSIPKGTKALENLTVGLSRSGLISRRGSLEVQADISRNYSVCMIPPYNETKKMYKFSICTATNRYDREYLVEWIEYHRLLGVQHFFIYDTSCSHSGNSSMTVLRRLLRDYIGKRLVSVIPWYWSNCAKHMASGRYTIRVIQHNGSEQTIESFRPPPALAQIAALASCYSRFRYTSTYIAHIDDDEFLRIPAAASTVGLGKVLSAAAPAPPPAAAPAPLVSGGVAAPVDALKGSDTTSSLRALSSSPSESSNDKTIDSNAKKVATPWLGLGAYADLVFSMQPKAPAIKLGPIEHTPCGLGQQQIDKNLADSMLSRTHSTSQSPAHAQSQSASTSVRLPRLDMWDPAHIHFAFEGKLIMRTEAVAAFHVHFITSLEAGPWRMTHLVQPPISEAALLHYRPPPQLSRDIYGAVLPIANDTLAEICQRLQGHPYWQSPEHPALHPTMLDTLRKRFSKRVRKRRHTD